MALGVDAAVSEERLGLVSRLMARSASQEARRGASYILFRGKQRMAASLSMEKKYINLVGGAEDSDDISSVMFELARAGFSHWLSVVPGPLMRATHGEYLSHMPLSPASTYDLVHRLFDEAYGVAQSQGDTEVDSRDGPPRWGHHSLRRLADTVARETMAETGATEVDIDMIFGWLEAMYSHKMQLHYESTFTRTRRTRVTCML